MQLALGTNTQTLDLQNYDLCKAILFTIAYSDIFDYPLSVNELHRYLIGHRASEEEIRRALQSEELIARHLISEGEMYALAGREAIFALRRKRAQHAERLWAQALRFGRLIGKLPFVRMVAATGALVSDNVEHGADLDYLIVTVPGYLWVTRAMILVLDRAARLSGMETKLCPNFLVTETNLALDERDLFTAQEMARMIPIAGLPVYANMRAQNRWTDEFLPNAQGYPSRHSNGLRANRRWKAFGEFALSIPPTRWLENWEMRRKIEKFSRQDNMNSETRFSADFCKGHFDGHKQRTMQAFETRIQNLELNGK